MPCQPCGLPALGFALAPALGLACWLTAIPAAAAQPLRDEAIELRFADFFRLPVGPRGLDWSEALLAADGRQVRLRGFMVAEEVPRPGRFLLTVRPVRLHQDADGEADDLPPATVLVLLDPAQRQRVIVHRAGPIELSGRLAVGRAEDEDGRVRWLRLQLSPAALAERHPPAALPEPAAAPRTNSVPSTLSTPAAPTAPTAGTSDALPRSFPMSPTLPPLAP
jgi:hypothetical protein